MVIAGSSLQLILPRRWHWLGTRSEAIGYVGKGRRRVACAPCGGGGIVTGEEGVIQGVEGGEEDKKIKLKVVNSKSNVRALTIS